MALINENSKIYVAGHNGMVGKAICKTLYKKGYHKVITIDKSKLDLCNREAVKNYVEAQRPEVVIIAAAKVGGILANAKYPVDFLLNNLQIQNNLIDISYKVGVKRLLFLASSCIYPKLAKQPIKEEELLKGSLESTNEWYAIAKIAGIKLCQALRKQYNFDAISLMPTNIYGPGDNYHPENSHVLASLLKKYMYAKKNKLPSVTCWGTGNPMREFLYSEDLAEACIFLLENWDPSSENAPLDSSGNPLTILNVGTGRDITIKELSLLIADLTGFKGETIWDNKKPDGTPKKLLDITRIQKLGWEPKISLKKGIIKTMNELSKDYF